MITETTVARIPILELIGTPYQRGCQHGESLARKIRAQLDWNNQNVVTRRLGMPRIETFLEAIHERIAAAAPDYLEEMRGIADGASMRLLDVVRLNSRLELAIGSMPINAGRVFGAVGCTSFAMNGDVSADGDTFLGQNYDLSGDMPPHWLSVPTRHHGRAMIHTFPGWLGATGMNSHGLALVINSLCPDDSRVGVPYPVLVRQALDERNMCDLLGVLLRSERAIGMNYVVGDAREVVDLETSATESDVHFATDGYLFHTNHIISDVLKPHDQYRRPPSTGLASSTVRYARFGRLMRAAVREGKVTLDRVAGFMSDHVNYPDAICCHEPEEGEFPQKTHVPGGTAFSVVYKPGTGEAFATNAHPCRSPLQRYAV